MNYRIEKDTMGEMLIPADKYWGAQTQRSLLNFPIGPSASMPIEIIHAFGYLKKAAAITNNKFGLLSSDKMRIISQVCDEIAEGKLDDQFPLVIWQTGSGTHTNMNCNEVIANRAHVLLGNKLILGDRFIHPNNDVCFEYMFFNLDGRYDELRMLSAGDGGRGGLNLNILKSLVIAMPSILSEQKAIAEVLGDMDAEIAALEQKFEKYKLIKQGMMQQLLTGKIRLV